VASLELRATKVKDSTVAKSTYHNTSMDIPRPKSVTYIDHDNPFSLVDSASGAPHISKISSYAWVGCGDNVYVLECLGKGYIRLESTEATAGKSAITRIHGENRNTSFRE
jgi:ATP-dependent helicase IRC3